MLKEGLITKGINIIYGEASVGKTLLCLESIKDISKNNKIIFLDIGNNFSLERFEQLEPNYKSILDNIMIFKIKSYKDQQNKIKNLLKLIEKTPIGLVVIDCFTYYYRTLVNSKKDLANAMLISQLKILNKISKQIPIILTNQVYKDLKTNRTKMLGKIDYLINFSTNIYELSKLGDNRYINIRKHKNLEGEIPFEIRNEGMIIQP